MNGYDRDGETRTAIVCIRRDRAGTLWSRRCFQIFDALRTAKNALVYSSGGIGNRPGTEFVGVAKSHNTTVRLIPFEASSDDTYALEFSNLAMRPIRNGGHVLESAKTISGATQANPVVITANAHGYSNGDEFALPKSLMTQLNQNRFNCERDNQHI